MRVGQATKLLAGSAGIYLVMAACGGSSDPIGTLVGGDAGAGITNPERDALADDQAKSGSRLKARRVVGDDGSTQFLGWHDSQRDEDCSFRPAADGTQRCLPDDAAPATTYFNDTGCAQALVFMGPGCAKPKYATSYASAGVCAVNLTRVKLTGAAIAPTDLHVLAGDKCIAAGAGPAGSFYLTGAEVAASDFAGGKVAVDP